MQAVKLLHGGLYMGDWERDMEDGPVVGGLCLEQKYQTPTNDVIT